MPDTSEIVVPLGFGRRNPHCSNCGDLRGGPFGHEISECRYRSGMTSGEVAELLPPDLRSEFWNLQIGRYFIARLGAERYCIDSGRAVRMIPGDRCRAHGAADRMCTTDVRPAQCEHPYLSPNHPTPHCSECGRDIPESDHA